MTEKKQGLINNHTAIPGKQDLIRLGIGVLGIGTSGPVIALSTMPVPILIFWRNLGGAILTAPFAFRHGEWRNKEGMKWSVIAGVLLALHFLGFFAAMRMTSVAAGTAMIALQPIFAALFLKFLGGHIPSRAWLGMLVSFVGVLLISGVDLNISMRAFWGDVIAFVSGALAALYVMAGSRAQQKVETTTYTTVCYFVCSLTVLPFALLSPQPMFDFSMQNWLLLAALILGAQILGHTMFNSALKRVSPAIVSLVVFFEVPVSAILAYWWLDQRPALGVIPGIILIISGCALVVLRTRPERLEILQ